jgi:hypothetical protein
MAEWIQERWYADIRITGKSDRWGPGTVARRFPLEFYLIIKLHSIMFLPLTAQLREVRSSTLPRQQVRAQR